MHKSIQSPNANRSTSRGRKSKRSTDEFKIAPPRTPTPASSTSSAATLQRGPTPGGSGGNNPLNGSTVVAPIPIPISRLVQSRKRSGSTIVPLPAAYPANMTADVTSKTSNTSSEDPRTKPALGPEPEHAPSQVPNILVFGETGVGKSSVINMIAGNEVAGISSAASGCTLGSQSYLVSLAGKQVKLWDTAGLNEGYHGSVPAEQAMGNLRDLVGALTEGISLLVYCIRGTSRFRDAFKTNYDLVWGTICNKCIPVVIVITGLEHQVPMESWWEENAGEFERNGMSFVGHACITATRGKPTATGMNMYGAEFEESKGTVRKLILEHSANSPVRWISDKEAWLSDISRELARHYGTIESKPIGVELEERQSDWTETHVGWVFLIILVLSLLAILLFTLET